MHSPHPQLFGFVPSHTALTSRQPSWRPIIRYLPYGVGRVGLGGKLGSLPSGFRRERFCFSGLPPDSISKPRRRTRSDSLPRRPISGHTSLATVCLRPFLSTPPASPPDIPAFGNRVSFLYRSSTRAFLRWSLVRMSHPAAFAAGTERDDGKRYANADHQTTAA